jgi:hypothetical protein
VFLFLPLLARLGFDRLVRQAGYPGSRMVPAVSALLSLLALKLLDKERRSHISDFDLGVTRLPLGERGYTAMANMGSRSLGPYNRLCSCWMRYSENASHSPFR